MKRLVFLLCAAVLVFALAVPSLAANTYTLDFSDVAVTDGNPSGYAKVIVDGGDPVGKMWARVTFGLKNSKGETSVLTQTGPVDTEEMEFDMPSLQTTDEITCVCVVLVDNRKTGPGWAGHNLSDPFQLV